MPVTLANQPHHPFPHNGTALIHISIRPACDLNVGAQLKTAEHDSARFGHGITHNRDVRLQPLVWRANQNSIMHRGADLDTTLNCQTTGEAQHFGAACLHPESSERAMDRYVPNVNAPPKYS